MPPLAVAISLMYWGCNPAGSFQPRETVRGRPPSISGSKSSTSTPTGMRSLPEDASAGEAVSDRLSTIANPSLDATADRRMPAICSRPSLHLGTARSYGNFAYMSTKDNFDRGQRGRAVFVLRRQSAQDRRGSGNPLPLRGEGWRVI